MSQENKPGCFGLIFLLISYLMVGYVFQEVAYKAKPNKLDLGTRASIMLMWPTALGLTFFMGWEYLIESGKIKF